MNNLYPKRHEKVTRKNYLWLILIVLGIVIIFGSILVYINRGTGEFIDWEINSFEDCVAKGYPIMESYPRQCRTPDGKNFVEDEQIIGGDVDEYGCLGAAGYRWNETEQACVKEWIKEGEERYQDRIYCKPEDRNSNMCTFLYDPVCAYPMKKTEPNSCVACSKEEIEYYSMGECEA